MSFKTVSILSGAIALLGLNACTGYNITDAKLKNGQYWQRASVSDATYQQGPKAVQMLNKDIANCVVELRELERLGALRHAIPTDSSGRVLDPDHEKLESWDTPSHDEYLLAEHYDYQDFEGCMLSKGWERVAHVPYQVRDDSIETYKRSQLEYKYQSRYGNRSDNKTKPREPYDGLNN